MPKSLLFKDYVKQHKRNFNIYAYEHDIHYRAVMFQQFSRRYRAYVEQQGLANDYITIAYEVRAYERRLRDYRDG